MEIRCKKGNCKHNQNCACHAQQVEINLDVACSSYRNDSAKQNISIEDGNLFNVAKDLPKQNIKNVALECRVKNCLYNRNEKCHANGITVSDATREADCVTYIKK